MKIIVKSLFFIVFLSMVLGLNAQPVVNVDKGSYAAYTPYYKCKTDEHGGDQSMYMQYRKLYITEREGQPLPTNDWWTNLITERYSGRLWSYPQVIRAQNYGLDVEWPSYWIDNGTEMKSNSVLKISAEDFNPTEAIADTWHDWDVEFDIVDGEKEMHVTMAHGMPFTWIEFSGIEPKITLSANTKVTHADGSAVVDGETIERVVIQIGDDFYGLYVPQETSVELADNALIFHFPKTAPNMLAVALLHTATDLELLADYAYTIPRETKVEWSYDALAGQVKTIWNITAENLNGGSANVLQGFIPHHYRGGAVPQFTFTDLEYATPHGKLRLATGKKFEINYPFYGVLPYYALPTDTTRVESAFDKEKMLEMLKNYADGGQFGTDTYWGGKGLTQMALYMTFAREMGEQKLFEQCRDRLKAALINWLTYIPGEDNMFFARYDRWGALIGYNTSYDSDTFNDHHFHYGYFTYAGALLAMVDDDFRDNYGQMLRELAKDYANWERTDTRYPMFRTFDPWSGHSFAGGMGDGNGNGQESSSEAMQSWGGLYLLGVALGDDAMRDAGLFGYVSEARATAEYWFDRNRDNIDYTKFTAPYNSNLTCHGVGWWNYFSGDQLWNAAIQWMPISPILDYLSEDIEFAKWDFDTAWGLKSVGGWYENGTNADGSDAGSLANESGLGNVVLSYMQRSQPAEAAVIFDNLWAANKNLAKSTDTNGITYFITHSHLSHGELDWQTTASIPTARAYKKADETYVYMAFNPTNSPIEVDFYRSGAKVYTLAVPARQLAVSDIESQAVSEIVPNEGDKKEDPRSYIVLENLALHRPCTESGHENVGCLPQYATDGDVSTRWGSLHKDNEWICVDLGQNAYIYSVNIRWEAAYASEYIVETSLDGNIWASVSEICSGGVKTTLMNDVEARYVRITGLKRATNYGISLYEFEVYGRRTTAADADLQGVYITAAADFLKQYQPTAMYAKGYTCGGDWIDVDAAWSSTQGSFSKNLFTPTAYGNIVVAATVGDFVAERTFSTEEALRINQLTLSPHNSVLIEGESQTFALAAVNQFGASSEITTADFTVYSNADGLFTLTENASFNTETCVFTSKIPGEYALVAQQGTVADTAYISVRYITQVNLAYQKPAYASSTEDANNMGASKAFDGDGSTRWGSAWNGLGVSEADNQHLTVDLQGEYMVNRVVMIWQLARASEYVLQVSADNRTWTDVVVVTNSPEGREEIMFEPTAARYVRMQGRKRNLGYGYSLYEMEVYGTKRIDQPTENLEITVDSSMDDNVIYTIDGRVIRSGKGEEHLQTLPQGVYIMNRQKWIVR